MFSQPGACNQATKTVASSTQMCLTDRFYLKSPFIVFPSCCNPKWTRQIILGVLPTLGNYPYPVTLLIVQLVSIRNGIGTHNSPPKQASFHPKALMDHEPYTLHLHALDLPLRFTRISFHPINPTPQHAFITRNVEKWIITAVECGFESLFREINEADINTIVIRLRVLNINLFGAFTLLSTRRGSHLWKERINDLVNSSFTRANNPYVE
ncbi:hypothetical protein LXL04_023856 [Taraxacum kok-saghyz]